LGTKTDQLEWHKTKVIGLRARGMTHQEIAHELQVSRTASMPIVVADFVFVLLVMMAMEMKV
jgi:orotate phosphoribosyltransferase-like protein